MIETKICLPVGNAWLVIILHWAAKLNISRKLSIKMQAIHVTVVRGNRQTLEYIICNDDRDLKYVCGQM